MNKDIVEIVRGLVRPFIAISITSTLIVLAVMGKVGAPEFLNLALVVVTFYFAERATTKGIEREITRNNGHTPPVVNEPIDGGE